MGEGNEDLKALIMAADAFSGPGILVPVTNADLFRWCLERGLRVVQLLTLMTVGPVFPTARRLPCQHPLLTPIRPTACRQLPDAANTGQRRMFTVKP
ncbi:MAG TPA: hypothetical protein VJ757_00380 [Pseudonocardiaceae bacterium]|nr:hypothetical protein [Pseudonocardiaceae bacterium]